MLLYSKSATSNREVAMRKENQIEGHGFIKPASILLIFAFIVLPIVSGISCVGNGETSDKIGVVVTILPQVEFVEKVGGNKVDITVMVPPGAEPHTYEPTPSQMVALSQAQIYAKVGSGIDFELGDWIDNLVEQNKDIPVINCSEGIALQEMTVPDEDGKEAGGMDPHVWMSPVNAEVMVQNICHGLVQVNPDNQAYYEENRDAYLLELTQLDQDIKNGLSGVTNRKFMVYHPSFGYFAEEYDLTMIPIEDEGKEPTGEGIKYVIDYANEHNIKIIFASPQFSQESAKVIASAIGGEVISIDPLAKNYIINMRTLLDELEQATEASERTEVFSPLSWILFAIGVIAIISTVGVIGYNLVHKRKIEVIHVK